MRLLLDEARFGGALYVDWGLYTAVIATIAALGHQMAKHVSA